MSNNSMSNNSILVLMFGVLIGLSISQPLVLTGATTILGSTSTQLAGSVQGGTTIIIKGTGFATDYTNIVVYVGNFPCILEDGSQTNEIACKTTSSGTMSSTQNLSIRVYQYGEPYTLPSSLFSYRYDTSPYIYDIVPSTSMPMDYINFIGVHRIVHKADLNQSMQDIDYLRIDSENCDIFGIAQTINANSVNALKCKSANSQQSGKYNVTQLVTPGFAIKHAYLRKSSFAKEYYEQTVLSTVESVTPNSGFPQGQDVIIKGMGFSYDKTKVTVNIDGTPCAVSQSTNKQISCKVGVREAGATKKLISNSSSAQVKGFIGGSGFKYYKYNIDSLGWKTYQGLKNAIASSSASISLIQQGISGQLEAMDESGIYGKVYKGYFYAPVNGDYIFRGSGDDNYGLYISDDEGTATVNPTPYIFQASNTPYKNNYYVANMTSALGSPKTMVMGKYYYMELYFLNTGGSGFVKISAEVPNTDTTLKWQRHQVNQISTTFTNDPEIRTFTLQAPGATGTFNLSVTVTEQFALQPTYLKKVTLPFNATASQFASALLQFRSYSGNDVTVSLEVFDINGLPTTSDIGAKYVWTATIIKLRVYQTDVIIANLANIVATGAKNFKEVATHPHGPLLRGTFTLQAGGVPIRVYDSVTKSYKTDIPYNIASGTLQNGFREIAQFKNAQLVSLGDCSYGCKFIISYEMYQADVPDLVLSAAGLTGGLSGTLPNVDFFETRKYSSNLLFNPVDERFLYTAENSAHVQVTVNEVLGACNGACNYQFVNDFPQVLSQSLSANQLSVTLSDPLSANYATSALTVSFDEQPCTNIVGTFVSFTCDLPINTDSTPIIRAGSHNVKVKVDTEGEIGMQSSVVTIDIPLTLSALTPSTGTANGGYQIEISGTGFPLSGSHAVITLCNTIIKATSITNILATIMAPECVAGTQALSLTYNGITETIDFVFTAASSATTITSISPQSWNPSLKGVMDIVGTGFPVASNMQIFLSNSSGNVYEMRILQSTATSIRCGIPGGLPGSFQVIVQINGVGNAIASPITANDFVYELVIESISPTTGLFYGGTLITLTGRNFSPEDQQTIITVGNQLNWFCVAQSITTTQITCRTPPTHSDWSNNVQGVILLNRLIVQSTCEGNCDFTYGAVEDGIILQSISQASSVSGSGSLTLTGTNFDLTNLADLKVVLIDTLTKQKTVVTPTASTATSITFNVPDVESGMYQVKVRLDPLGESNSVSLNLRANFNPTSYNISTEGGQIVLTGNGLPNQWPSELFSIQLSSNGKLLDVNVISAVPNKLKLKVPAGIDGQQYSVILTNPLGTTNTATFKQLLSYTPTISIPTLSAFSAGSVTVQLTIGSLTSLTPTSIYVYNILTPDIKELITYTISSNSIDLTHSLPSGRYSFAAWYDGLGWAKITGSIDVVTTGTYTVSNTDSSFAGGQFIVTGTDISPSSVIKIGGLEGKVISQTGGTTVFEIPALITADVIGWYPALEKSEAIEPASIISDGGTNPSSINDQRYHTEYESTNASCYIGIDAGADRLVNPKRIRYFPYSQWAVVAQYLQGAIIQGSVDNTNYVDLHTVGPSVHSGWNSFLIDTTDTYRYFRISHDSTSACHIAQFQVVGVTYNNIAVTDQTTVDVIFNDGHNQVTWAGKVIYKKTVTPVVQTLSQKTGSIYGGYDITLTGLNLGALDIVIDGVVCVVQTQSATSVVCEVGQRLTLPDENSFKVSLTGNRAVLNQQFLYVMRWSDIRTWGTDLPPVEGDLVLVPKGMSLYVDQSTPRLDGIVVEEGKLIFADEGNSIQVHTNFITLVKGEFQAGTQEDPYQSNLKFVMYGSYYGKHQPMFGNKGIGCNECKFSMFGKVRSVTWTMLQTTVNIGDTSFTVIEPVDWQQGEKVVVASTDFDFNEAQQMTIASIVGTTITVTKPFVFKHYAGIETYGTDTLEMRAEVGLLSRNIKMTGDDTSEAGQYGSHLMMTGSAENGMVSHVGYTQFTHCGQPRIVGRYCIHFHMNGDVADSLVIGNAVHHSFARVITIHAVHYLRVIDNVGYLVKGHNFFIEDGIQTHNVLDHNLAVASLETFNMMQTDISVASFWITNPLNDLINNHAAGGDFYGFWYEIKDHPDGPSARSDVCPTGNPLGASHHNVAHSYTRFGLRIFKLQPRTYPCKSLFNSNLADPWSGNPSIQSTFSNYVTYKIGEAGLLAQEVGNMVFENFVIAESKHAGMEFYITDFTKELVIAKNIVIIGVTQNNAPSDISVLSGARGAIGPRTSNWKMDNVRFYDFPASMTVLETCSKCDDPLLYTNLVIQYFTENIEFTNISGPYLFQKGLKRSVIYDQDASFSANFDLTPRTSATIVPNYPHLAQQANCLSATTPGSWDQALTCDQSLTIRGVKIGNMAPHNSYKSQFIKVQKLANIQDVVAADSVLFSQFKSLFGTMEPMDEQFSYSMLYVVGSIYNVWWGTGIDYTRISIEISQLMDDTETAILFKFNNTQMRELFEIGDLVKNQLVGAYRTVMTGPLDSTTCNYGDYTHDFDLREMSLCISPRGSVDSHQLLDVSGIKCRYLCPSPTGQFTKENFVRNWSNTAQWPGGVLPQAGDNVSIHGNWTILMDIVPAEMQFFLVDGDVHIDPKLTGLTTIKAKSIWIRAGSINAGNSSTPHPGQVTFEITGNKNDVGYVIDPTIAGTKLFVVTGKLALYGATPGTTWTRMAATAAAGSTTINVKSTSGWQIGNYIVIGPSFSSASQSEKVQITAISGTTVTFTPALLHKHYGASGTTISNSIGTLDTRAAVGLLSRQIKIKAGSDSGWGFRLIGYSFLDGQIQRKGQLILQGVELEEGGQYDTEYGAVNLKKVIGSQISSIKKSSFHNCKAYCLDIQNSINIGITSNVFYQGRINHVRAITVANYNFQSNLMISAIKRPTLSGANDLIACYASWNQVDQTVAVSGNVCQGSDLHGFALGMTKCETQSSYSDNTANSAPVGFIFNKISSACMKISGVKAFACDIGQISSPPGAEQLIVENFIVADSGRAVTLRFGKEGTDRSAFFRNSYITAISRPTCTECYGTNAIDCSGNQAVRMLAVTVNGQSMPDKFGSGFDVICRQQTFDSKAFVENVTFDNYRQNYSSLPQCSNNVVFKPHSAASDMTGSHHLRDTTCVNCQLEALASFTPPDIKHFGWSGGCGNLLCTGKNNYLIHDYTGGFLPQPGILIANNSQIGDNSVGCTHIQTLNGHYCTRQDFGVIQYESIAPDFDTRIMWPVYLKYEGGTWNTTTNAWKQWQWSGNQPLNRRLGRFVSIVELSKIYNMTFESEPPIDMRLQFQRRTHDGDNSQFIVIKLHYPRPNSIRVMNAGTGATIKPISLLDNNGENPIDTTVCGSNKFFYKNNTIHFVLTGAKNCRVRVSLTNSIQLSARFDMDINQFFSIDGQTKFIDRMCALLGVLDTSRLKIVGVYAGSVIVDAYIDEEAQSQDQATNHNNVQSSQTMTELQARLTQLQASGAVAAQFPTSQGFGTLIELQSQAYDHPVIIVPEDEDEDGQDDSPAQFVQNNIGLIIGVIIGGVVAVAALVAGALYIIRKRAKIVQVQELSPDHKIQDQQLSSDNYSVLNFGIKK